MNIKIKCVLILTILILVSMTIVPKVYAVSEILSEGQAFVGIEPEKDVINEEQLEATSTYIYKVLLSIAICVSVIIGAVLGVQFIFGSVEGKAKVSEALIPYVVGCFIIFGAFTIWSIVINIGNSLS